MVESVNVDKSETELIMIAINVESIIPIFTTPYETWQMGNREGYDKMRRILKLDFFEIKNENILMYNIRFKLLDEIKSYKG